MKIEEEIQQQKFKNEYQKLTLNIIYTANWLSAYIDSFFKDKEITLQQYNVLRILRGQYPNPSSIKLIRERLLDRNSDTSRMVDKLVAKELAVRSQCQKDKRGTDVIISEKGLQILSSLDFVDDNLVDKLKALPEEKAILLNKLLDELRD